MSNDTLARARAVVARLAEAEGKATARPWSTTPVENYGDPNTGYSHLWTDSAVFCEPGVDGHVAGIIAEPDLPGDMVTCENAAAIVALRNAAPALIALAEAVGRLVEIRAKMWTDSDCEADLWRKEIAWNDGANMICVACGAFDECAPDCPALAIDRALAELAALAPQEAAP